MTTDQNLFYTNYFSTPHQKNRIHFEINTEFSRPAAECSEIKHFKDKLPDNLKNSEFFKDASSDCFSFFGTQNGNTINFIS